MRAVLLDGLLDCRVTVQCTSETLCESETQTDNANPGKVTHGSIYSEHYADTANPTRSRSMSNTESYWMRAGPPSTVHPASSITARPRLGYCPLDVSHEYQLAGMYLETPTRSSVRVHTAHKTTN